MDTITTTWEGTITLENIEAVAHTIRQILKWKRYTHTLRHRYDDGAVGRPIVSHNRFMQYCEVQYAGEDPPEEHMAFDYAFPSIHNAARIAIADQDGVWIIDVPNIGHPDYPYILFEEEGFIVRQFNPSNALLDWTFLVEQSQK